MNIPPEVYGALSVAQNHLTTANGARRQWRNEYLRKKYHDKHMDKVQKLISRAVKLLRGKEVV